MGLVGTLLAEEERYPELLERFRSRLVRHRRAALRDVLEEAVRIGELSPHTDVEMTVNMLVGSFYARYLSGPPIPGRWPQRALAAVWPEN
jgi:hypothetical protein